MNMFNIGIMGALISNENMGCVALTYSLVGMLEKISQKLGVEFSYRVFEFEYCKEQYNKLSDYFDIEPDRIKFVPVGFCYLENWKLMLKSTRVNIKSLRELKRCDMVIDLTQGDSFTDIYGAERFYRLTVYKEITEKMGIPLILGPQTYGPFEDSKIKKKAGKVIERAQRVISRDQKSVEYLKTFVNCEVDVTTDLAFALPFENTVLKKNEKIRVGINPSGLLFSEKTEKTQLTTLLKTNYDLYIKELISKVSNSSRYEVHFIPHVGDDAVEKLKGIPNAIYHSKFLSPVEAKNLISTMDIFIGSRMHATIAAFSSGVATIPVAYSRKFAGLYENLGYNYIINLCEADTDDAILETMRLIEEYRKLKNDVLQCMDKVIKLGNLTEQIFEMEIRKVIIGGR